MAETGLDRLI